MGAPHGVARPARRVARPRDDVGRVRREGVVREEVEGEQGIAPHADGPIYAPRVANLSLFSPAVLRFYGRQPGLATATEWSSETDTPSTGARLCLYVVSSPSAASSSW